MKNIIFIALLTAAFTSCGKMSGKDNDGGSELKMGLPNTTDKFGADKAKLLNSVRLEISNDAVSTCGKKIDQSIAYQEKKVLAQKVKQSCEYGIIVSLGDGGGKEIPKEKVYFSNITEKELKGYILKTGTKTSHLVSVTLFPTAEGRAQGFLDPIQTLSEVDITIDIEFEGSKKNKHTVMVIDDGFDVNARSLKGKIKATYNMDCSSDSTYTSIMDDHVSSYASTSNVTSVIQALRNRTERPCTITEGPITAQPGPELQSFQSRIAQWNADVWRGLTGIYTNSTKYFPDTLKLEAFFDELSDYHGTGTASVIAMQNDNVEFILVQMKLGRASEAKNSNSKKKVNTLCTLRRQNYMDWSVKLYDESGVEEAILSKPDETTRDLAAIAKKHNVSFINMSYGLRTTKKIHDICSAVEKDTDRKATDFLNVDVSRYYQKRFKYSVRLEDEAFASVFPDGTGPLRVQSAGNDSSAVDNDLDSALCPSAKETRRIYIGSSTYTNEIAEHSNYGRCVFVSTLGENVVMDGPIGMVVVHSGTSFAAPLSIKLLTQKTLPGLKYSEYKNKLKELATLSRNNSAIIPVNEIASIHVYDNFKNVSHMIKEEDIMQSLEVEPIDGLME